MKVIFPAEYAQLIVPNIPFGPPVVVPETEHTGPDAENPVGRYTVKSEPEANDNEPIIFN